VPTDTVDPFAIAPLPWWRRVIAPEQPKYAPRRYAGIAAMIGPALALFVSAHHRAAVIVPVLLLFAVPPALVEAWFKARYRRRHEQLLMPTGHEARSAFGAAAGPVDGDRGQRQ
jgi:hypothetical protein